MTEVPHIFHAVQRNAVRLPLRNSGFGQLKVSREVGCAPFLSFEPCIEVHAQSLVQTKPFGQGEAKPQVFSINLLMDDARRAKFLAYFDATFQGRGGRQKLIEESGKHGYDAFTKGRVAQLFNPKQPFGERTAKSTALRLGLAEDAFITNESGGHDDLQLRPDERAWIQANREVLRFPTEVLLLAQELAEIEDPMERARAVACAALAADVFREELRKQRLLPGARGASGSR